MEYKLSKVFYFYVIIEFNTNAKNSGLVFEKRRFVSESLGQKRFFRRILSHDFPNPRYVGLLPIGINP
jgi:hypothetical protein